jgi:putative phosphoesterase
MEKMKILVFSDSHGRDSGMQRALSLHPDAEGVFFLGDGAREAAALAERERERFFIGVKGNCDGLLFGLLGGTELREEEEITLMGRRILLLHGHTVGVKGGLGGLIAHARRRDVDLALFGHTHEPLEQYLPDGEKPLYLFNPGSISRPRGGAPTYGVLTLTEGGILLSHGTLA